jgi:hypothetical protein
MINQMALRSGYHTANMATEIPCGPFEASDVARHCHQTMVTPKETTEITVVLANHATVTGADRATGAELTKSLAELTDVTKAQAGEVRSLIQSGHVAPVQTTTTYSSTTVIRGNGRQRRSGTNEQGGGVRQLNKTKNNKYCWSHGYYVGLQYTSATCTDRKAGHNPSSTKSNIMGGDTWGSDLL